MRRRVTVRPQLRNEFDAVQRRQAAVRDDNVVDALAGKRESGRSIGESIGGLAGSFAGMLALQQHALQSGNFYSAVIGTANPSGWTLGAAHVFDSQFHDIAQVRQGLPEGLAAVRVPNLDDAVPASTNDHRTTRRGEAS